MKIIERYVLGSFLTAFFLAWLILSFVLTIGLLVKIIQLILQGLPPKAIGLFMLVGFPGTLQLTIPIALLVSALLVFSRLSADSEIAAMRACGVNLLSVMKWPILVGTVLAVFGFYINNEVVPRSHEVSRNLKSLISVDVGLTLLEPGRIIDDFDNYKLYFKKRQGNWVEDLLIFDSSNTNGTREIHAEKALITTNGADLVLELYRVRVDPIEIGHPGVATADRYQQVVPQAMQKRSYKRKEKDLRFNELREFIQNVRSNPMKLPRADQRKLLSIYRTEYQLRWVYAMAAICFVLVGVPLGIKAQRKESTIGMALSLAVALMYYVCVIMVQSLDKFAALQPYVLIWIPVAVCGLLAAYLIPKNL
jgi:lipopolysaccharide export system permease protein